ncbi:MAG: histidyl-tRNA synthetase, partial [Thermoplasmata archaeon]|nr:histidyl-tRNA synthetase [Thermoplasmata archaeon]
VLPIVAQLRSAGVEADLDLLGRKPGAVAKHADAVRARYLVIVGDRDLEAGSVQAKELATGQATALPLGELAAWLKAR